VKKLCKKKERILTGYKQRTKSGRVCAIKNNKNGKV
jgi:hypothetical protein